MLKCVHVFPFQFKDCLKQDQWLGIMPPWPLLPLRALGIWVIFSAKTVYDTLSMALSCAGSPVQILTQDESVSSVLQDLKKASSKGQPQEADGQFSCPLFPFNQEL